LQLARRFACLTLVPLALAAVPSAALRAESLGTCSADCDKKASECVDACEAKFQEAKPRVECKVACITERENCEKACK
jgi:hypothetical protein